VVVAPTGVAAINAGGTTIHSFFQLPFTPFIPVAQAMALTIHISDKAQPHQPLAFNNGPQGGNAKIRAAHHLMKLVWCVAMC